MNSYQVPDYREWMLDWGVVSIAHIEKGWAFALEHERWAMAFGVTNTDGPLRIIVKDRDEYRMFAIVEYYLENWQEIVGLRVKEEN